jgi:SAM-dependent methyltransferase
MPEWFEDEGFWEAVYPTTFPPERFALGEEEVAQVLRLAPLEQGRVLDLCCGPGRHAIPLARRGLAVTGVDRSAFLLARVRERATAAGVAVEPVQEDMRRFVRPGAFDLAIDLFTSFGYFADREEDLVVLRHLRTSLRPRGHLVMDLMGRAPLHFVPTWSGRLGDGALLVERTQALADWTRVRSEWIVVREGRARTFEFACNPYSGQELRDRLREAGFGAVRIHRGLDGRPYDVDAARLVVVARTEG